jgi:hypothetical protein
MVILLILRRALSILLDSIDLVLINHTVLIIIVACSWWINMRILIWCLWRIDCSCVLLLRGWRSTNSTRSTYVRAIRNISTTYIHHLTVVIILLILAHSI